MQCLKLSEAVCYTDKDYGSREERIMSGFFGVASKEDCVLELFYGVDYHSHLGTRRGGMAVYGEQGFDRAIHNIENTPFRTKFDGEVGNMKGNMGIGCISDYEPQPLLFNSRIGSFALTFVGKINNYDELLQWMYNNTKVHFQEMTNGTVNVTELPDYHRKRFQCHISQSSVNCVF